MKAGANCSTDHIGTGHQGSSNNPASKRFAESVCSSFFLLLLRGPRPFHARPPGRTASCHDVADSWQEKPHARPPDSCWSGTEPTHRVGCVHCCAVSLSTT